VEWWALIAPRSATVARCSLADDAAKTKLAATVDVRYGSEADMPPRTSDVGYAPKRWGNRPAACW